MAQSSEAPRSLGPISVEPQGSAAKRFERLEQKHGREAPARNLVAQVDGRVLHADRGEPFGQILVADPASGKGKIEKIGRGRAMRWKLVR